MEKIKNIIRRLRKYYRKIKLKRVYKKFIETNQIKVKSVDDTIDKIINDKCSIIRFGDGELQLIKGNGISFQEYNEVLSKRLREIISYKNEKLLIGVPKSLEGLDHHKDKKSKDFWLEYIALNNVFLSDLFVHKQYWSSGITRIYNFQKTEEVENRFRNFFKMFENRDIILVEGEFSRLGYGNDLFANVKSLKRILCPTKHAFAKYDEILKEVLKYDNNYLILLSLGPTAKLLAYDLFINGYQVLDVGHIDVSYEWFKAGATEKIQIENKFVNEVENGDENLSSIHDEEYLQQVIAKII